MSQTHTDLAPASDGADLNALSSTACPDCGHTTITGALCADPWHAAYEATLTANRLPSFYGESGPTPAEHAAVTTPLGRPPAFESPSGGASHAEAPASLSGPENGADGAPSPTTKVKVAIVGFTSSRAEAWPLLDDPEWDVWGMNNLHAQPEVPPAARFDRWWDLHPADDIMKDAQHAAWLASGADGVPVQVWQARPEWPTSLTFNKAEVVERFGRYFTNSVSWMLSAALLQIMSQSPDGIVPPEGAAIAVFGIDMAQGGEYSAQRPSCEYHLGIAVGRGIEVILPPTSDLLQCAEMYGEASGAFRLKMEQRLSELLAQQAAHEAEAQKHRDAALQLNGAVDDTRYYLNVWTQPNARRTEPETP